MAALFGFMGSMFIMGSVGFYIILFIELGALLMFCHVVEIEDQPMTWYSSISMVALSFCLILFGDFNVYIWVFNNKLLAILAFICYIGIGFIVSCLAYGFRAHAFKLKLPEYKKEYKKYVNQRDSYNRINKTYDSFNAFVYREYGSVEGRMLKLKNLRNWIIYWIAFYPVGIIYKIVFKGIRGAAAWTYDNLLIGIFTHFHDKIEQFSKDVDSEMSEDIDNWINEKETDRSKG